MSERNGWRGDRDDWILIAFIPLGMVLFAFVYWLGWYGRAVFGSCVMP